MYLKLFGAVEDAVNLLIAAQQECEELYISAPERKKKATLTVDEQKEIAGSG